MYIKNKELEDKKLGTYSYFIYCKTCGHSEKIENVKERDELRIAKTPCIKCHEADIKAESDKDRQIEKEIAADRLAKAEAAKKKKGKKK